MFDILSIGDSKYLADILNSLAMITATDSFTAMCKIAVMVGVIGVVFSSLMNGGKSIDYHHILVAYIIWACMFVPKVSVQIEDKYTNVVYKVDNVPLGPAAAGTFVSAIGSSLTDLFEVAYSPIVPGMSTTSFLESLQLLTNARESSAASMFFVALDEDAANGLAVKPSIVEYIKNCTLKKIDVGITDFDHMRTQSYEAAIKFDTPVFQTTIYTTAGGATTMGCDTAWNNHLAKDVRIDKSTIAQMGALFGLNSSNLKVGETAKDKLDSALNALTGASISADTYMKTVLYESLYAEATQVRLHEGLHSASSVAVNQAIQQRNSDWAGGHSLFMTTVRPMIAFFEAFIYAITPIMAFTILLGALGVRLALKYFMLILWVQLWYPLLSIINLYIFTASQREIATNGSIASYNWDSFYAVSTNDVIAQTWISTGGLLATSTPAIALFLVTGSAVAFTSLSSKLAGNDYYNEKQNTPDLSGSKPLLETTSMYQGNKMTGQTTGVGGTTDGLQYSTGETASKYSTLANTVGESSSKTLSSTIANTKSSSVTEASTLAGSHAFREGIAASGSESTQAAWNNMDSTMKSAGLNSLEQLAVDNAFRESADAHGSIDLAKVMKSLTKSGNAAGNGAMSKLSNFTGKDGPAALEASLGVSASATETGSAATGSNSSIGGSSTSSFSIGDSGAAASTNSYAQELSTSRTLTTAAQNGDQDAKTVQAAAASVVSSQKTRTDAAGINTSLGSQQTIDAKKFSAPGTVAQGIFNSAQQDLSANGYGQQVQTLADDLMNNPQSGVTDKGTAMNMAVASMIMNPQRLHGIENNPGLMERNANRAQAIFASLGGTPVNDGPGAPINKPSEPISAPSSNSGIQANSAGTMAQAEGATAKAPTPLHLEKPASENDSAAVRSHFNQYKDNLSHQSQGYSDKHFSPESKAQGASILAEGAAKVPATPPKTGGWFDALSGEGNSRVASAVRAASGSNHFQEAMTGSDEGFQKFRNEVKETNAGRFENLAGGSDANIASKTGAGAIVGLASAAEYAIGAVEKAKGFIGSDSSPDWAKFNERASQMPMQELGQMSAYGAMLQLQNGAEAFTNYKQDLHQQMVDMGTNHGLTQAQAQVFADGFTGGNVQHRDALRAEINATHSNPQEAEKVYSNMEKILSGASNSSSTPAAYLSDVANYNLHTGTNRNH